MAAAASPSAHAKSAAAWTGLGGPTRVIDLLNCKDLSSFMDEIVSVFYPTPFLPNICLMPDPTFDSTLKLLEKVLPSSSAKGVTLLVYLEDVNRIHTYSSPKADGASGPDNTPMTVFNTLSLGGALARRGQLVGRALVQKYSHTGLRTQRCFFPALSPDDPQLVIFAEAGGRLWDYARPRPSSYSSSKIVSVVDEIVSVVDEIVSVVDEIVSVVEKLFPWWTKLFPWWTRLFPWWTRLACGTAAS